MTKILGENVDLILSWLQQQRLFIILFTRQKEAATTTSDNTNSTSYNNSIRDNSLRYHGQIGVSATANVNAVATAEEPDNVSVMATCKQSIKTLLHQLFKVHFDIITPYFLLLKTLESTSNKKWKLKVVFYFLDAQVVKLKLKNKCVTLNAGFS